MATLLKPMPQVLTRKNNLMQIHALFALSALTFFSSPRPPLFFFPKAGCWCAVTEKMGDLDH